jgi:hypothetical protein
MHRTAQLMMAIWLLGTSTLAAQGLPEGTFASSKEGCAKLKTKTPAELSEGLDFTVVSKTGFTGYQQQCDFVNVTARNATSWLATAYCEEQGYAYPDLFAVAQKQGGNLSVTRLATQQDTYEGAAEDDQELADQDIDPSEPDANKKAGTNGAEASAEDQPAGDDLNTYVRCDSVKQ